MLYSVGRALVSAPSSLDIQCTRHNLFSIRILRLLFALSTTISWISSGSYGPAMDVTNALDETQTVRIVKALIRDTKSWRECGCQGIPATYKTF